MGIDHNHRESVPGQGTRSGKPPNIQSQVAELCELQRQLCGLIIEDGREDQVIDIRADVAALADRLEYLKASLRG